jgi:hypothetical protein
MGVRKMAFLTAEHVTVDNKDEGQETFESRWRATGLAAAPALGSRTSIQADRLSIQRLQTDHLGRSVVGRSASASQARERAAGAQCPVARVILMSHMPTRGFDQDRGWDVMSITGGA